MSQRNDKAILNMAQKLGSAGIFSPAEHERLKTLVAGAATGEVKKKRSVKEQLKEQFETLTPGQRAAAEEALYELSQSADVDDEEDWL